MRYLCGGDALEAIEVNCIDVDGLVGICGLAHPALIHAYVLHIVDADVLEKPIDDLGVRLDSRDVLDALCGCERRHASPATTHQ